MNVKPLAEVVPGVEQIGDTLKLFRPFKCTCLCFNRTVLRVSHPQLGDLCECR